MRFSNFVIPWAFDASSLSSAHESRTAQRNNIVSWAHDREHQQSISSLIKGLRYRSLKRKNCHRKNISDLPCSGWIVAKWHRADPWSKQLKFDTTLQTRCRHTNASPDLLVDSCLRQAWTCYLEMLRMRLRNNASGFTILPELILALLPLAAVQEAPYYAFNLPDGLP